MTDLPVLVFDAKGDMLAWNAMAVALLGDFTAQDDRDVLLLPDTDQRMVVYSAAPGTAGAESLALLRVLGVQDLSAG